MTLTMSSSIFFISAVHFMLLQIILIDIVKGESSLADNNATYNAFQRHSDRVQRSPHQTMPPRLKLWVKYPTGKKIELIWIHKLKYLANQHLPVTTSFYLRNLDVMKVLGEFEIYQDVERCSAAVYFKKDNSVYGVIGLNHAIANLPFKFNKNGQYPTVVETPFISQRAGLPVHNDPILFSSHAPQVAGPSTCSVVIGNKRQSDSDSGPTNKHQRTERDVEYEYYEGAMNVNVSKIRNRRGDSLRTNYFLEILLFITSDIVEFFKRLYGEFYFEWIARYYIVYFNSVDVIFQKLQTSDINFRINIARIVTEDTRNPFNFVNNDKLQFSDTVTKLREYLKDNKNIYTPDSFDHVFISTSRPIMEGTILVGGTRDLGEDSYEARGVNEFHRGVPITAVGFEYDYVVAVHEISRTLEIQSDPWLDGLERTGQCNSIMQEGSSKCDKCFKWSENSEEQFRTYFRTNRNRCFLLNEPRSLRPHGMSRFLSPIRQCQCFGHHSYVWVHGGRPKSHVRPTDCDLALQCGKLVEGRMIYEFTIPPFDGTNCGTHKVCWNRWCSYLQN